MTGLSHIRLRWARYANGHSRYGLVYYLERADGAVKIGCTHSYPRRRQVLVRQHGYLALIAWERGSFDLEQLRHQQFAHLRLKPAAEWFAVDDDLLAHICGVRGRVGVTGAV